MHMHIHVIICVPPTFVVKAILKQIIHHSVICLNSPT